MYLKLQHRKLISKSFIKISQIIKQLKFFFIVLLFLTGCTNKENSSNSLTSEQFDRMTAQEQADLAPTALFRSVYRNDSQEFQKELKNSYVDLVKKNIEGDTALAAAIQLRRNDFVIELVKRSTFLDLTIGNKKNRSFLSLLAEHNMETALDIIAEKYIQQLGLSGHIRNNFNELDFPDDQLMRAHFYAHTASFLDKLQGLWFYGALNFQNPWDNFFNHKDISDNTFLHHASLYNKTEVIKWYIDRHCGPNSLENDNNWLIIQYLGLGLRKGRDFIQDADFIPVRRRFINQQNIDGNSPLHLAAGHGNYQVIELLFQCEQSDPTQENMMGQVPLQYMLASIDPDQAIIADNYKYTATLFVEKINPIWGFVPLNNFKNLVNHADQDNFTTLHYAARLNDSFFYDLLKIYELPNTDGNGVISRDRSK